jgi:hypothetical protein
MLSYEICTILCQTGFVYEMKTSVNTLRAVVIPFGDFTGLYRIYTLHNMHTVQVTQNNDRRLNGFQTTAHDRHPAREDVCIVARKQITVIKAVQNLCHVKAVIRSTFLFNKLQEEFYFVLRVLSCKILI